jgi:8-oxo-dGTP pyrophosphatase MutT (NUDIX family)
MHPGITPDHPDAGREPGQGGLSTRLDRVGQDAGAQRWAAVSVILAPDPDAVLLIRRAERSGDPWSGHIGLPGGRAERGDTDLVATAIRETVEEIGWPLSRQALLGELDDVWPRTPLPQIIVVRPFVFAMPARPAVVRSPEVAEAFWVRLADLQDPAIFRDTRLQVRGQQMVFPAYHLRQGVVWGLTERILTPLLSLIA